VLPKLNDSIFIIPKDPEAFLSDRIITHPPTPEYRDGWERVFGKLQETSPSEQCPPVRNNDYRMPVRTRNGANK